MCSHQPTAGMKVTATEYYRRAQEFYSNATLYAAEEHPRQLPLYRKMVEMFDKHQELSGSNIERVQIPWEGKMLRGFFRKPGGAAGPASTSSRAT